MHKIYLIYLYVNMHCALENYLKKDIYLFINQNHENSINK